MITDNAVLQMIATTDNVAQQVATTVGDVILQRLRM
jgi:hypothetical protein